MVITRKGTTNSDLFKKKYSDMVSLGLLGKTLTITPVTKTTDNDTGDETLTEGTSFTTQGTFWKATDSYFLDKPGLLKGADAVITVKADVNIGKDYKVTWNSESFRVDDVEDYALGPVTGYKYVRVFVV